jgi:hypothetical protein
LATISSVAELPALHDTINKNVAAVPALSSGPVLAEHFWRAELVEEGPVEDSACLDVEYFKLSGRNTAMDDIALLKVQSAVVAVLGGGGDACDVSRAECCMGLVATSVRVGRWCRLLRVSLSGFENAGLFLSSAQQG